MLLLAIVALSMPAALLRAPQEAGGRGGGRARDEAGPPVLAYDEVPQAEGAPGDLPPLARRTELGLASVDLDEVGRTRPELADLSGTGEGFALLLSDERDGARSFVLQALDRDLEPSGPPQRVDERASGRGQHDGSLALAPDGVVGAVWLDAEDRRATLRARLWGREGRAFRGTWSTPLPPVRADAELPAEVPASTQPVLAWTEGACFLAWNARGRIVLRELDPSSAIVRSDRALGRRAQHATSAPRLAIASGGELACGFDSGGGVTVFLRLDAEQTAYADQGPGKLAGIAADAETGGWWLGLRRQGRLMLRHLDRAGAPDREDVELTNRAWRAADLVAADGGACALVQPVEGGLVAVWYIHVAEIPRTETELAPAGVPVLAARLARDGDRWACVWTERGRGNSELFARACAVGGEQLTERRALRGGEGSAHQVQPSVAFAGDRGLVAWSDLRADLPAVGVRGLGAGRRLGAGELFLPAAPPGAPAPEREGEPTSQPREGEPAPDPGAPPSAADSGAAGAAEARRSPAKRPAVAIQPSGKALVAWLGDGAAGPGVFVQALEVDELAEARPLSAPFELDPGTSLISTAFPPAVLALRDGRGFAVAWVRASAGTRENPRVSDDDGRSEVRMVRVGASGMLEGAPRTAGAGSRLAHPALAQLDDGRIVLAWDAQPHVRARRLAARVLSEGFEPELRELAFETMWRGSDHSPAIAPASGGFALAWTSGEDEDCDVFARAYDAAGRPLSRPWALTPRRGAQRSPSLARAGSGWVAVWQDDLSGHTRLVGTRLGPKGPGPLVRFALGPEARFQDAWNPRVLALEGERVLLVGDHPVAGKGREVGLCLVGRGWDEVEGR